MAQGTTTVDFGAFPGKSDTSVAVIGQTAILSGSLVEAWVFPTATADHSADEHIYDPPTVTAGTVVAGTGFTIYAAANPRSDANSSSGDSPRPYGLWTVAWVWA